MPTTYTLRPRASNRIRLPSDGDRQDAASVNRALVEVGELTGYARTVVTRNWSRERLLSGGHVHHVVEGLGPEVGGIRQSVLVAAGSGLFVSYGGELWDPFASGDRYAVAYSAALDVWAAAGVHAASAPGATFVWTDRTTPSNAALRDMVVDGDGAFVAVGDVANDQGYILRSTDGVVWEQQVCPVAEGLSAVAYGDGMLVAVGGDGDSPRAIYSDSGVDWYETAPSSGVVTALEGVAFDGTWFVARDRAGKVMRSADGMSWETTEATGLSVAPQGGHVAADPETGVVIVAAGGHGQIQVSYDHGETFQAAAWLAGSGQDGAQLGALSFARGRFWAGSTDGHLFRSLAR